MGVVQARCCEVDDNAIQSSASHVVVDDGDSRRGPNLPSPRKGRDVLVLTPEVASNGMLRLLGVINIGSAPHNDFMIQHPSVSSTQALLEDRYLTDLVGTTRLIREDAHAQTDEGKVPHDPSVTATELAALESRWTETSEARPKREKLMLGDIIFFGEVKYHVTVMPDRSLRPDSSPERRLPTPGRNKRTAAPGRHRNSPSRSPRLLPGVDCQGARVTPRLETSATRINSRITTERSDNSDASLRQVQSRVERNRSLRREDSATRRTPFPGPSSSRGKISHGSRPVRPRGDEQTTPMGSRSFSTGPATARPEESLRDRHTLGPRRGSMSMAQPDGDQLSLHAGEYPILRRGSISMEQPDDDQCGRSAGDFPVPRCGSLSMEQPDGNQRGRSAGDSAVPRRGSISIAQSDGGQHGRSAEEGENSAEDMSGRKKESAWAGSDGSGLFTF